MKIQQRKMHPGTFGILSTPIVLAAVLLVSACTDARRARGVTLTPQASVASSSLTIVGSIKFAGAATQAYAMTMAGSSLFVTGTTMGFMRLETSANPEAPSMTFNQHDISNVFPANGWTWSPDWYGSGAIGITGSLAILSGSKGTSVVNLANATQPREIIRYPGFNTEKNLPNEDAAFQYTAIIPNGDYYYGFRRNDFVHTYQIAGDGLELKRSDAYNGGNIVCCVTSGTTFAGSIYVAFTDSIVAFDIDANRFLTNPGRFDGLQATYITSTSKYIYVQHSPTYSNTAGQGFPRGIYAFDANGRNVAFFPGGNYKNFAVAPNDRTLYANRDDQSIEIYRMNWQ